MVGTLGSGQTGRLFQDDGDATTGCRRRGRVAAWGEGLGSGLRSEGHEGIERGVPLVRRPRARALTDQMYVLQPDNGPSRTSSGSPAALLDLVEAIVSRAFSLGPLPPHRVQCPHMATYRGSKTEKEARDRE